MKITNKNYNIKGKINTNIVLISDIHYYNNKDIKHLNKVLDKIKQMSPKYICISGDIIDEAYVLNIEEFIIWIKKLSKICCVLISLGNHEYYINKKRKKFGLSKEFINKIKQIPKVYLLDNKNVVLEDINFIGITLPIEYYLKKKNIDECLGSVNSVKDKYNILLCHSPLDIVNSKTLKELKIDLILSGHTHGGATPKIFRPLLKTRGLISPDMKLFPCNVYGNIKVDNTNIIITSGITVISHLNKFRILKNFFSSEIVCLKIKAD